MIIFRPWRSQYGIRSLIRAIWPSSRITSQITAAGISPARRARSTPASVCPVRSSTPPGLAFSGKTWPGCTRSWGSARGSIATWIVWARSWAEMPGRDSLAGLDRHRERGLERGLVLGRHQVQAQLVAAIGREREADQAPRLARHEVDVLGRGELCRERQVTLVLAVLVVADDDHPARPDVLERVLDAGKGRYHSSLQQLFHVLGDHVHLKVNRAARGGPFRGWCAPGSPGSAKRRSPHRPPRSQ